MARNGPDRLVRRWPLIGVDRSGWSMVKPTRLTLTGHWDQGTFQFGGIILRDASRSLSSGAHSRDPLAMLLRMRSETLMVRSAATPRVSNHQARSVPDGGSIQLENALAGHRPGMDIGSRAQVGIVSLPPRFEHGAHSTDEWPICHGVSPRFNERGESGIRNILKPAISGN
jgi:hypothetical protein